MKSLKSQILALANRPVITQKVSVEGLDAPIYVKKLSAGECIKYINQQKVDDKNHDNITSSFLLTACDEKGESLFTQDEIDTIETLPFELVFSVAMAGLRFNGLADKDIEQVEKNS
ncbi:hypothetical protein [Moraxella sp.]|uniref:hypothetical protein n=1 Tax=Moraxella sp. TaxID=479 RepID=UPI0026DD2A6A|nr:hypothetical protein [Moraxella sp.]MDO4895017.1 hypothetical protein [Moraxella sp.]